MKAFERFGGFILNGGAWILAGIVGLGLSVPALVHAYTGGKTAEVTSKEFVCTATSAVGIEPRCDQYTRVSRANLTEKQ